VCHIGTTMAGPFATFDRKWRPMCPNGHGDGCKCLPPSAVSQSLDEIDFDRGLWPAAKVGNMSRIQKLLADGKPATAQDRSGYTALHYAARNDHLDVCTTLLGARADVNAVTKSGRATALHRAAYMGHTSVVQLLLKCEANPALRDSDGHTALHKAATGGHATVANLLACAMDGQIGAVDRRGRTAHVLAVERHPKNAALLRVVAVPQPQVPPVAVAAAAAAEDAP